MTYHRGLCRFDFDKWFFAVHYFVQVIQMVIYGKVVHILFMPCSWMMRGHLRLVIIIVTQIQTFLSLPYPIIDKCIFQTLVAVGVVIKRLFGAIKLLWPIHAWIIVAQFLFLRNYWHAFAHSTFILMLSIFLDNFYVVAEWRFGIFYWDCLLNRILLEKRIRPFVKFRHYRFLLWRSFLVVDLLLGTYQVLPMLYRKFEIQERRGLFWRLSLAG